MPGKATINILRDNFNLNLLLNFKLITMKLTLRNEGKVRFLTSSYNTQKSYNKYFKRKV